MRVLRTCLVHFTIKAFLYFLLSKEREEYSECSFWQTGATGQGVNPNSQRLFGTTLFHTTKQIVGTFLLAD